MLLSRFWYLFLAVAVAAATGAALLSQAVINARSDEALSDALMRDRAMIDAMLRLEARARLDRMAFITVDAKLGGLLKQSQGVTDEKKLRELSTATKETLRSHNARMVDAARQEGEQGDPARALELEPDLVFALDIDGRILAQLGPLEANPPGASLATYPLVKRALQGYLRDDVWLYDRRAYRVAARPVMHGTEYAGAIVHGYRLEKGLVDKLAKNLGGATISFFQGTDLLGTVVATGAPQAAELSAVIAPLVRDPKLAAGQHTEMLALQGGGRAVVAPITGSAAGAGVGLIVARPRRVMTSPEQLFAQASQDEVKSLPIPILAGGALGLALIGLLFVYVEHDRHLSALRKKTGEIAAGERDRLIVTEWRGAYRKLADHINQAIDKETEKAGERAPSMRKKANLDELLGPTPEASGTPFFGFAEDASATAAPDASAVPAAPAPRPGSSARLPDPPARPKAPTPGAAPLPPVPAAPASRPMAPPAASPPPPNASPAPLAAAPAPEPAFDENAHWHDVYEQYVATRRQCSEPIESLTFDKFAVTLRKTRDQVVEKHAAKTVRFAVHVKDGKAALKAQPIKQ